MGISPKNVKTQFWDARKFLWKWVGTVQMLHIVDMLQMFQMLVECYYCLWNVTIACGMLLLLVECYDSLWNVTIACGMLR